METPGPLSICLTNMVIVFGVLIFLAFFIFVAWRLNAAFWKDVK